MKLNNHFNKDDHEYGKKKEEEYLPALEKFFGEKIKAVENQTSEYDYLGESGKKYELKSFRNYSFRPYVPVIDQQKVRSNEKHNTTFVFAFVNPEELYYIEFDKELFFNKFKWETMKLKRGYQNPIVRIPHEYLKPIPLC